MGTQNEMMNFADAVSNLLKARKVPMSAPEVIDYISSNDSYFYRMYPHHTRTTVVYFQENKQPYVAFDSSTSFDDNLLIRGARNEFLDMPKKIRESKGEGTFFSDHYHYMRRGDKLLEDCISRAKKSNSVLALNEVNDRYDCMDSFSFGVVYTKLDRFISDPCAKIVLGDSLSSKYLEVIAAQARLRNERPLVRVALISGDEVMEIAETEAIVDMLDVQFGLNGRPKELKTCTRRFLGI